MHISTFSGEEEILAAAIEVAERTAQRLLDSLSGAELVSVQAQTLVALESYIHIITIVYE